MNTASSIVTHWLDQFATCVRNRDLHGGRALFAPEIAAFGTRAETAHGLADLIERQWSRVWFDTRGFRFLADSIRKFAAEDDSQICLLALWESEGADTNGVTFARRGRCTVVLRRERSHPMGYVAVHTHFSKTPPDEL